jgi:hypothetical protein
MTDQLSFEDLFMKELNDPNSPAMIRAKRYMDACEKEYQNKNPCPNCKSHNTHLEPVCINGPESIWVEYCDDCGWERETNTKTGITEKINPKKE